MKRSVVIDMRREDLQKQMEQLQLQLDLIDLVQRYLDNCYCCEDKVEKIGVLRQYLRKVGYTRSQLGANMEKFAGLLDDLGFIVIHNWKLSKTKIGLLNVAYKVTY